MRESVEATAVVEAGNDDKKSRFTPGWAETISDSDSPDDNWDGKGRRKHIQAQHQVDEVGGQRDEVRATTTNVSHFEA